MLFIAVKYSMLWKNRLLCVFVLEPRLLGLQIIVHSTLTLCACGFDAVEEILCAIILFENYCN